jgi:hypothetical protein
MKDQTPYTIKETYKKRLMNAKGYVIFWQEHVKKYPDKLALTMLKVAEAALEKIENEIKKL